jgi:hypothetical protein
MIRRGLHLVAASAFATTSACSFFCDVTQSHCEGGDIHFCETGDGLGTTARTESCASHRCIEIQTKRGTEAACALSAEKDPRCIIDGWSCAEDARGKIRLACSQGFAIDSRPCGKRTPSCQAQGCTSSASVAPCTRTSSTWCGEDFEAPGANDFAFPTSGILYGCQSDGTLLARFCGEMGQSCFLNSSNKQFECR